MIASEKFRCYNMVMDIKSNETEKKKFFTGKNTSRAKLTLFILLTAILFTFLLFNLGTVKNAISGVIKTVRPVLYGIAIAYLLNPLSERIRRLLLKCFEKRAKNPVRARKAAKGLSIGISVAFALVVIIVLLWMIIPQIVESISTLVAAMPGYIKSVTGWYNKALSSDASWVHVLKEYLDKALGALSNWMSTNLMDKVNTTLTGLTSSVIDILSFIVNMFIGIVVAVYALIEKDLFVGQSKKLTYALFKPERANRIIDTARHGDKIFGGFLSGKILDSLIVGVIAFICLPILGIPYPVLISVIIGVTNIIPFFGPFIGAIPSAFFVLLIDPVKCLWFIIFVLILQQVDGNIIGPKILGSTTGISEFWVTFALLLSGGLFGFTGMIIGVPLFAVIYYVIKNWVNERISAKGLPTQSELYHDAGGVDPETLTFTPMPEEEPAGTAKKSGFIQKLRRKKK